METQMSHAGRVPLHLVFRLLHESQAIAVLLLLYRGSESVIWANSWDEVILVARCDIESWYWRTEVARWRSIYFGLIAGQEGRLRVISPEFNSVIPRACHPRKAGDEGLYTQQCANLTPGAF